MPRQNRKRGERKEKENTNSMRNESERLDLIEVACDTQGRKPLEAKVSSNFK